MKKNMLIGLIIIVLVILGFVVSRSNNDAPTTENVKSAQAAAQQPAAKQPTDTQSQVENLTQNNAKPVDQAKPEATTQTTTTTTTEPTTKPIANPTNDKKTMGLDIKTTQEGTGDRIVKSGDTVSVLYTGKLMDGTVFDASAKHGNQPFDFTVGAGMVIKGWDQGLLGAKVGEKRTLTIPGDLAYGPQGIPGTIPANATLVFDVEVLSVK